MSHAKIRPEHIREFRELEAEVDRYREALGKADEFLQRIDEWDDPHKGMAMSLVRSARAALAAGSLETDLDA